MNRRILLTGCSGGGKSTLLAELASHGLRTVEEPGRRIVAAERAVGGHALPWIDPIAFARQALALGIRDHRAASHLAGWTLFDRGVIDAAVALRHATGATRLDAAADRYRYHIVAFLVPPWPEIYAVDEDRRHDFEDAIAEYERLSAVLPALGYTVVLLPCAPVRARADLVLETLDRYQA